jgi:hypothetical protein
MMVPKKSLAFTGATLIALSAFAGAQSQKFSRYSKPLTSVSMNLETGVVTRGPQVSNQAVVTTADLKNLDLGGFIGVDTGAGFCEWIDAAEKGSGAQGSGPVPSDLVSNFVFAYCSAALDTASGGPGGTMTWSFFPSHTTGAAHPATSDSAGTFTLTGLPSNTAAGAVFAQIACFFINITFGSSPLPFADGKIGYSWTFEDADSVGIFAATFPFLSCVTSCSGTGLDAVCMDDFIDQYCPANIPGSAPLATFSFGTTAFGGYFTSVNIELREVDVTATSGTYDGSTPGSIINPDRLTASPVIIGSSWSATVTAQAARAGASVAIILVQTMGAPGVTIIIDLAPILIGFGDAPLSQLLVSGSLLGTTNASLSGGGSMGTGTIAIPLNTGFVCLPWYAQAIVLGDVTGDGDNEFDPMFSNAATGIVGSQ